MIDLTNAPEGATHYAVTKSGKVCWYLIDGNRYKYMYWYATLWSMWSSGEPMHMPLNKVEPWSIYNNTKPLSELANEQAGELFKHEINGGILEQFSASGWHIYSKSNGWKMAHIYRAKQKTERELFIEAAFNTCPIFTDTKYDHEQLLSAMFDSGNFCLKAPKVGE